MHILQKKRTSLEITSKELYDSLKHISCERPHIWHFLYFVPYIITTTCMIYTSWLSLNLSSCINIIIPKNEFKWQYVKTDSTLTLHCVTLSKWVLSIIWQGCYKLFHLCILLQYVHWRSFHFKLFFANLKTYKLINLQ